MGNRSATAKRRGKSSDDEKKKPPWSQYSEYEDSSDFESDGEWDSLPEFPEASQPRSGAPYHYLMKLLLVGECRTGKTSFLYKFVEDAFNRIYISTIGIDFKIKTIAMDERHFKLQMWDTSGQERFHTITTAYYRGSHGVFIFYDTTRQETFDKLPKWIKNVKENTQPGVPIVLIGGRCDMKKENDDDCVDYLDAKRFADEHGLPLIEVSMKDGTNIEMAITHMVAKLWRRIVRLKQNSQDD